MQIERYISLTDDLHGGDFHALNSRLATGYFHKEAERGFVLPAEKNGKEDEAERVIITRALFPSTAVLHSRFKLPRCIFCLTTKYHPFLPISRVESRLKRRAAEMKTFPTAGNDLYPRNSLEVGKTEL